MQIKKIKMAAMNFFIPHLTEKKKEKKIRIFAEEIIPVRKERIKSF
ncbi:MAG: hypothetical protein Fur0012_01660 [Elusimicrobiota bacterium]